MTALIILCCLVGGPYFGGKRIYDQVQAGLHKVLCADMLTPLNELAPQQISGLTLSPQKTREQQEAEIAAKAAAEEKKKHPFSQVDVSYLDDAVFIGDSRTDTLRLYSGWDNTTFYCKTGTNIWNIMEDEVAYDEDTGETVSVTEGLKRHQFAKVYLMLGINELGTGTAETFYQQFKKVVSQVRELQPEAVIFVQSIMHVADFADDASGYINNQNINERNALLKKLADNETVFYLDENEALDDENGCLKSETTYDGIHMEADYISLWTDYLLSHGVVRD
jgi:hypothetical protein